MYTGDRGVTRQRGFMRTTIKIKLVYLCHPITGIMSSYFHIKA